MIIIPNILISNFCEACDGEHSEKVWLKKNRYCGKSVFCTSIASLAKMKTVVNIQESKISKTNKQKKKKKQQNKQTNKQTNKKGLEILDRYLSIKNGVISLHGFWENAFYGPTTMDDGRQCHDVRSTDTVKEI